MIELLKSWHNIINMHIFIIYFHKALVHFYLSYFHALYLANTLTNIFCIVRDLSALGVMEDSNHGFIASRWLIHNRFMSLGNLLKVVVHHLLIWGMVGLGYQDKFPMVSALVHMVTHWIRPIVSYDLSLSSSHDFTK